MAYFRSHILVCTDPECVKKGSLKIMDALKAELEAKGLTDEVEVMDTPRIGDCDKGPEILVFPENYHYINLEVKDIPFLVEEQFLKGRAVTSLLAPPKKEEAQELREPTAKEIRVVLRNCGKINPENIEDYIAEDGYSALAKVLTEMDPDSNNQNGHGFRATWSRWSRVLNST